MIFPPSTYAECSTCGVRCVATVTHGIRIGSRVVVWPSCFTCNARDEARWQEQRKDEERERLAAAERTAEAARRDAQRVERQRAKEAQV